MVYVERGTSPEIWRRAYVVAVLRPYNGLHSEVSRGTSMVRNCICDLLHMFINLFAAVGRMNCGGRYRT